jgi:hypothetical protein
MQFQFGEVCLEERALGSRCSHRHNRRIATDILVSKKYLSTLYITIIFLPNGIRDNYLTTPIVAQSGVASDHVGKVYQNVLSKEEKRSMGLRFPSGPC